MVYASLTIEVNSAYKNSLLSNSLFVGHESADTVSGGICPGGIEPTTPLAGSKCGGDILWKIHGIRILPWIRASL